MSIIYGYMGNIYTRRVLEARCLTRVSTRAPEYICNSHRDWILIQLKAPSYYRILDIAFFILYAQQSGYPIALFDSSLVLLLNPRIIPEYPTQSRAKSGLKTSNAPYHVYALKHGLSGILLVHTLQCITGEFDWLI
jgi:hypothetical protein